MKNKTLAFDAHDVEQFKEFFPDFKSGNMTGRELGRKLIEMLKNNQTKNFETPSVQANENEFNQLKLDYQKLKEHCEQLEAQLAEKVSETFDYPLNSEVQKEIQDSIDEKNELKTKIQDIQSQNLELKTQFQDIQRQKEALETEFQNIQKQKETLETRCKELKTQLKEVENHQNAYTFTPYFKQLIEVVSDKINAISATNYSPTDVIMQTTFATYFNSHTSIRYTYPISREELLTLAQQFYPEVKSEKELFNLMIYKVKEEEA